MVDAKNMMQDPTSRRGLFRTAGAATLSAAGLAVLAGCTTSGYGMAHADDMAAADPENDANLLNTALGLEHEGIAAYQIAAESGLLEPGVLALGILFQGHHKAHRDAIVASVNELGGTPVETRTIGEYAEALNAASLQNQGDILRLALGLEQGAANAYLGVMPSLVDGGLKDLFGRIAADEAVHWTVFAQALGEPIPEASPIFGA